MERVNKEINRYLRSFLYCQCVDGVQIAGMITTKPSSARWFVGHHTSYLYSIHTMTKLESLRSNSPGISFNLAEILRHVHGVSHGVSTRALV